MTVLMKTIFRLCCAGILCSLVQLLVQDWKGHKPLINLICGLMLLSVLLQPIAAGLPESLSGLTGSCQEDAERLVQEAERQVSQELSAVISDRAAAYIKDKAAGYGAIIEVQVTVNEAFLPAAASISGTAAPYARSMLEVFMERELGIDKASQEWRP